MTVSGECTVGATRDAVFDKLVYSKLRTAMGGNMRWAVSGGGPLGARLGHFFRGINVTILEGYGLTETSAATTVNRPSALRVGSVGQPLPNAAVKVAEDGELLLGGGQIFVGYWNNPGATADVFTEDGWFRTGDMGFLDPGKGEVNSWTYLTRIGDALRLSGFLVNPMEIESYVREHAHVDLCYVVGVEHQGRTTVVAFYTTASGQPLAEEGKTDRKGSIQREGEKSVC